MITRVYFCIPGRDKAGLDGATWEKLPDTETAIRRESATGVDARSRSARTYSEVTSPKIKSKAEKVIPTDPSALSFLSAPRPGESKEEYLSRLSSLAPVAKEGKMVKKEEIDVGKANAKELLDKTLYHVLTDILSLELDDRHARWCHLLHVKDCDKWIRFEELNLSEFENMEYESNGGIIKFTKPDIDRFKRLNEFIQ